MLYAFVRRCVGGLAVAALSLWLVGSFPVAASAQENPPSARAGEAAVLAALAVTTEVDFQDVPLGDAIAFLEERHGIEIEIDATAVDEAGASMDGPASLSVRGISLRSALSLLLRPHGLTWIIRHDVLTITSQDVADNNLYTEVYPINDLLTANEEHSFIADDLIGVLWDIVYPSSWDEVGGPGSAAHVPSGLAISQTRPVHEEIALLLANLRRVTAGEAPRNETDPAAEAILAALAVETEVVYDDVPLEDLLTDLTEKHGLQVVLDRTAIDEAGAAADTPVTVAVRGVTLRNALDLVLHAHGLTWIIQDEVLVLTSEDAADNTLSIKVYPVADILAKGFEGAYGIDELRDTIQSIVCPQSWDEVGGPGGIPNYSGALIVNQVLEVHEEIEQLLVRLRELPAEEFSQQASLRLKVYTLAGADPGELAGMIRQTIDWHSWQGQGLAGEGIIEAVRALPPPTPAPKGATAVEELADKSATDAAAPPTELPQFGGVMPTAVLERPVSGWLLVQQSRKNHERIEALLRRMGVLHQTVTHYQEFEANCFPTDE